MSSSRIYGTSIVSASSPAVRRGRAIPAKGRHFTLAEEIVLKAFLLILIAGLSYMLTALACNMKAERSRQAANRYTARANTAEAAMGDVRKTIEMLSAGPAISQWARQNQFELRGVGGAAGANGSAVSSDSQ